MPKLVDTSAVEEAIEKANVTGLELHQYVAISVMTTVDGKQIEVQLNVFPSLRTDSTSVAKFVAI